MMNVIARPHNESPHELRELAAHALRKVKVEGQRIDALALIGLVATASNPKAKKNVLTNCLIGCPRLNEHLSRCHFNRVALSPALTAEGAYLLVVALGNHSPNVENTCLAIGVRILGCKHAATELFNQVWADFGRQLETDIGEKERDDFHGEALQAEARQTAMMNKLQASTQAILLAVQL